ncbi:hypothetical protein FEM48_Zijuj06G0190800 [Ziziphus jujuba var. spinosa]|uniref:Uncharacterized protein n=1 Tax=Ziziphus jujuba var. spinosa TaxID=714518 RepID=A0A978VB29_ZIZJJ|nr:hypothetical protein FEM48_Zijuj06G0190800 [Ziziphus jujuba var. spinosa]
MREVGKSFNVNEEYLSALRTKSYADFFTKAQLLVNQDSSSSSSSSSYNPHLNFSEILLEPCQEAIPGILDSPILSKIPKLKSLLLNYFDISAEASNICSHLLKTINRIQSSHSFIQLSLDEIEDYSPPDKLKPIISDLVNIFVVQTNPFSNLNNHDFKLIHDKHSSVLHRLKSMRKKVCRKIKLIKYLKKATGICVTAACGLVALIAIVLAAHTLTALLMGPALFSFPFKSLKEKITDLPFLRSGFLRTVGEQLDVAAKGTYILDRDFDTMGRLVARLHDEVEHNRSMVKFCMERKEERFCLQVVKELKKSSNGFRKQVEELEEHLYLCLVTINRARALVIKEMKTGTAACVKGSL